MKILIVDGSVIYRKAISDIISQVDAGDIAVTASNLSIAMKKIELYNPDIIILNGDFIAFENTEILADIYIKRNNLPTIILKTPDSERDEQKTIQKLLGTNIFETILKDGDKLQQSLISSLQRFKNKSGIFPIKLKEEKALENIKKISYPVERSYPRLSFTKKREVVAIGISTGGPNALTAMMPMIPANINVPILIVQHMPPNFTKTLGESLNQKCQIEVREAAEGDKLRPGLALIAPGGKHMIVEKNQTGEVIVKVIDDKPVNNCKPSADVLFSSVAKVYGERAVGVIMTGMGSDGTKGLREMKKQGSFIIAQDEKTCIVFGMPRAPIEEGIVDIVSPLEQIAGEIARSVGIMQKNEMGSKS